MLQLPGSPGDSADLAKVCEAERDRAPPSRPVPLGASTLLWFTQLVRRPDDKEPRTSAPGAEARTTRVRGNPVEIRNCPAAVSRNDRRHQHWAHSLGSDGQ
ncbi:hypothetical protein GCM10011588_08830 [Nocardia jinanensis]|uniref:Uncharacterized protein n=1 Tax=Nocardia jinanensis TaxID=382504 RepID=A0A917VMQ8_9NOCA|nr:hypothetical protein GCM10011588_08830 [Nocardia jinanensis]